ncbi:hypothetical protein GV054_09030 [Marinomonas mediterranea]|uniref:hypothetical protein n=1 Tax=Marinomonas mediterranea TaxID=119864 RepID=UPI00234A1615|nr:hypothetical protein [Marinomonas mediterranea]WCN13139.1 hypothetical protein GV054_09030 [Marinomonas mediterranea]
MTITKAVADIGRLGFTGNVTPKVWYKQILTPSGKPDFKAVALLSEIVYWYRPRELRDEHTGAVTGYQKRFSDDMLHRSYASFSEDFGMTKREAQEAIKRLRDAGLIRCELRNKQVNGTQLSNVLYIEPVAQKIEEITFPKAVETADVTPITNICDTPQHDDVTPIANNCDTPHKNLGHPPQIIGTPPTKKRGTYTEINSEINSETTHEIGLPVPANPKPKSKRASNVPDQFIVDQRMLDWLVQNQITTDWQNETKKFMDYHQANGSTKKDWVAAWRLWMRNSMKFSQQRPTPPATARDQVQNSLSNIHDTNW